MPRGVIALIALLAVVVFPAAATGAARKAHKTRNVLYAKEIACIQVGDHPQRMRMGKVRAGLLGTKKSRRPRRAR